MSGDRNCGADTSFPNGPQLQCPSISQNLNKIDHKKIENVNSWVECARKCRRNEKMENEKVCNFWEWDGMTNCWVTDNATASSRTQKEHLIIGDRMCGSCVNSDYDCRSSNAPNCNQDTGECFYCENDDECMNQSNQMKKCSKSNGLCVKGLLRSNEPDELMAVMHRHFDIILSS